MIAELSQHGRRLPPQKPADFRHPAAELLASPAARVIIPKTWNRAGGKFRPKNGLEPSRHFVYKRRFIRMERTFPSRPDATHLGARVTHPKTCARGRGGGP